MLACRNLLHDRARFAVTLVGIVFSVVLSAVQRGLFLGFTRATVVVIERSNADLWVTSKGTTHLESGVPLSESLRNLGLGVDGVAAAQVHIEDGRLAAARRRASAWSRR
jgi:putative ABC transport system permease protein